MKDISPITDALADVLPTDQPEVWMALLADQATTITALRAAIITLESRCIIKATGAAVTIDNLRAELAAVTAWGRRVVAYLEQGTTAKAKDFSVLINLARERRDLLHDAPARVRKEETSNDA